MSVSARAASSLPRVVSTSRSVPRAALAAGLPSRCSSSLGAPLRAAARRSSRGRCHSRCRRDLDVFRIEPCAAAGCPCRRPRRGRPWPALRMSFARWPAGLASRDARRRSAPGSAWRRCRYDGSPGARSGAASRIRSIRLDFQRCRLVEALLRTTARPRHAHKAVNGRVVAGDAQALEVVEAPCALPPSSGRRRPSVRRWRCLRRRRRRNQRDTMAQQLVAGMSGRERSPASLRAFLHEPTRSEDGNTCTRFSSRVSSVASSSQDMAVRTRVSSVAESRSNSASSPRAGSRRGWRRLPRRQRFFASSRAAP